MNKKFIALLIGLCGLAFVGCTASQVPDVSEPNASGDYYAIVNKQTLILWWTVQKAGVMKCHKGGACKEVEIVEQ